MELFERKYRKYEAMRPKFSVLDVITYSKVVCRNAAKDLLSAQKTF
jgi:hypothetical protein